MTQETDSPATGAVNPVQPLRQERIIELLQQRGWSYFVDSDGDLGFFAHDLRFYLLVRGQNSEILHGTCDLMRSFSLENLSKIRDFIARWHKEHVFPRLNYVINDHGAVRVSAEYIVDYEAGLTDEQLITHIQLLVSVSDDTFTNLLELLENNS